MEPKWTQGISSAIICNYFYIFFVIYCVFAGLSLLSGIWIFSTTKMTFGMLAAVLLNILLTFGIAATTALFFYLICDRALKPSSEAAQRKVAAAPEYGMMM